jgi:hypothetical protein
VAYVIFLRSYPHDRIPEADRRLAPVLALGTMGLVGLAMACSWVVHRLDRSW